MSPDLICLMTGLILKVYAPISEIEEGLNVSLHTEYIINKAASVSSDRFKWILGGWGPCSASCGGGKRQKTVACWDNRNQKLVRRKHCSLMTKPTLPYESCNIFDCHFQWIGGKWEPCSTTCGLYGMQHRELYCVPQAVLNKMLFQNNGTILDEPWRFMVNPNKCSGIAPTTERPCNRIPCFSYWSYGEWSQCSETCGKGYSYRSAYCPPPESEHFYTCGEAPPLTQKRICHGYNRWSNPACKKRKHKPCIEDQSDFCSLSVLSKFCQVGGFRRICCKSCFDFRLSPISI